MQCVNCGHPLTEGATYCEYCGGTVSPSVWQSEPVLEVPLGKYKATAFTSLEIQRDAVIIHKVTSSRRIPFEDIAQVALQRGHYSWLLTVHGWDERDLPLPTVISSRSDPYTVEFARSQRNHLDTVNAFLSQCARTCNRKRRAELTGSRKAADISYLKKLELEENHVPYCPECLSLHVTAVSSNVYGQGNDVGTRFVCLWCGNEWFPIKR